MYDIFIERRLLPSHKYSFIGDNYQFFYIHVRRIFFQKSLDNLKQNKKYLLRVIYSIILFVQTIMKLYYMFYPCVFVCLSVTKLSVSFFSATFHCRCLKFSHIPCLFMSYVGIMFCTIRTSTYC